MFKYLPSLRRPPTLLTGLEINRNAIRLVELSHQGKHRLQLQTYGSIAVPDGVIGNDSIEDLDLLTSLIGLLWRDSGAQSGRIAIGVPAALTVTSRLSVTNDLQADDAQLQELAQRHIAPLLPYPIEEARLDFCLLPPCHTDEASTLFIAAVPLSIIEDHLALVEPLGLEIALADINCYAEYAAWASTHLVSAAALATSPENRDDTVAMLRIDADTLHCSLFCDAIVLAAQACPTPFLRGENNVCATTLADAAAQLMSTLLVQAGTPNLRQIVLTGTLAASSGLTAAICQRTNTDTEIATPFAGMSFAQGIDASQLPMLAPAYLAACGLALRQLN